ncbi:hypothetical protein HQ585_15765 [candidate division KSB1 bacterium]|nr:hypothetical protein [candidate division KSB1 bacterium]
MAFTFSEKDYQTIAKVLGSEFRHIDQSCRLVLENKEEKRKLSLEIYNDIPIGKRKGNLISVYTSSTHMQLHFCSGYVASDMLGEVTFMAECGEKLSGLIIEKGAGCSLYSNVDAEILSGDFTQLGPEVMLSGIALSLAESILPDK